MDLCEKRCIDLDRVARARGAQVAGEAVQALADVFRVLGDPTRLRIVEALSHEELCVCDIATLLGVSQSVVSHSLRALRQMRLVRYRRAGKIAYYALDDSHIATVFSQALAHVAEPRGQTARRRRSPAPGGRLTARGTGG